MRELVDHRSLSMPETPFSAYCRQCWEPIYSLWVDGEHSGACAFTDEPGPNGLCMEAHRRQNNRATIAQVMLKASQGDE